MSATAIVKEHVLGSMKTFVDVIESAARCEGGSESGDEDYVEEINSHDTDDEGHGLGPASAGADEEEPFDKDEFADFLASDDSSDGADEGEADLLGDFLAQGYEDLFLSESIAFAEGSPFLAWHTRWLQEKALPKLPEDIQAVYPFFEGVVTWTPLEHAQFAGWTTYRLRYVNGTRRYVEFPATWSDQTLGSLWFCANPCLTVKTLLFSNTDKGEAAKDIARPIIEGCYEHIHSLLRL